MRKSLVRFCEGLGGDRVKPVAALPTWQGFCPLKSFKNGLKMRCENAKLFLTQP